MAALADGATSMIPISDGSSTIEPWVALLRAHMIQHGIERALADANLAIDQLPPESGWITSAFQMRGVLHALSGELDSATNDLTTTIDRGLTLGTEDDVFTAHAQLALLAMRRGAWGQAAEHARAALALVNEMGLADYATSATTFVATARVAIHEARLEEAREALAHAHRLRPLLDHGMPWFSVQVGLELTRAHLLLGEPNAARTVLREAERILELRPDLGFLVADARELHERVAATSGPGGAWAMSLTGAELRLLPYLATHLTFPEMASRLYLSRNTVKTEAVSIYRKFGVSSRGQAIERAVEVGLLDGSIFPPRTNLTPEV